MYHTSLPLLKNVCHSYSVSSELLDIYEQICNKKKSVCQKLSSLMNSNNVDKANIIFILAFEVRLRTHALKYMSMYTDEIINVGILTNPPP